MNATQLDAKHALETVPLVFPFAKEVPVGVTITSTQRLVRTIRGTDPAPNAVMQGAQALDAATSQVYQMATGGVPGCSYLVLMQATLSNGEVLVRAVVLPVIEFISGSGV